MKLGDGRYRNQFFKEVVDPCFYAIDRQGYKIRARDEVWTKLSPVRFDVSMLVREGLESPD